MFDNPPNKEDAESGSRTYDVWFGVGFAVQAATSEEAEKQARLWLENVLCNADLAEGLSLSSLPLDLAEAAVRTLQMMAKERAAGETSVYFSIHPTSPSQSAPETKMRRELD